MENLIQKNTRRNKARAYKWNNDRKKNNQTINQLNKNNNIIEY